MSDQNNVGQGLAHLPAPTVHQRAPHDLAPPPPSPQPSAAPPAVSGYAPAAPLVQEPWASSPVVDSHVAVAPATPAPTYVPDPLVGVAPSIPEQPAAWSNDLTAPIVTIAAPVAAAAPPAAYAPRDAPAPAAVIDAEPTLEDRPNARLGAMADGTAGQGQPGDAVVAVAPVEVTHRGRGPAPAGTSLAELDARNISAWFGDHKVLDRVSLLMPAGQVTALIGPSGCGKSTFLRILNRMHELIPSASMAGEVVLDGQDVYAPERRLTEARRHIGMVFQKPNPFPAMTIYDNVIAGLQLTGTKASSEDKDALVEECLTKAGLWKEVRDRLRSPGGGLSGGQQQRLCIARSLAIKPRVLLMDEPCSALDPTSTRRIEETILELVSDVTIVIVTHNMQQAARVSDQCAFFLASAGTPGVIVEYGATDAMFSSPVDERTHDYVNGRFG